MDRFLELAREAVERTAGPLSPERIGQPADGRWSIAEILEHLTLAFRANAAAIDKVVASGELRARRPVLKQRLVRVLVIDFGYFPRAEAPERTRPQRSIPPGRSLTAIREALSAIDAALTRAESRFGDSVPVSNHPYFAGLTVRQWRKFHWRHTVHHMKQVRSQSRG
jgi:hypothetical protein